METGLAASPLATILGSVAIDCPAVTTTIGETVAVQLHQKLLELSHMVHLPALPTLTQGVEFLHHFKLCCSLVNRVHLSTAENLVKDMRVPKGLES
jgi:hypothetical protein